MDLASLMGHRPVGSFPPQYDAVGAESPVSAPDANVSDIRVQSIPELNLHLQSIYQPHHREAFIDLLCYPDEGWGVLSYLRHDENLQRHGAFLLQNLLEFPVPLWDLVHHIRQGIPRQEDRKLFCLHLENNKEAPSLLTRQNVVDSTHLSLPTQRRIGNQFAPSSSYQSRSSMADNFENRIANKHPSISSKMMGFPHSPTGRVTLEGGKRQAPKGFVIPCPFDGCKYEFSRQGHWENHINDKHPVYRWLNPKPVPTLKPASPAGKRSTRRKQLKTSRENANLPTPQMYLPPSRQTYIANPSQNDPSSMWTAGNPSIQNSQQVNAMDTSAPTNTMESLYDPSNELPISISDFSTQTPQTGFMQSYDAP